MAHTDTDRVLSALEAFRQEFGDFKVEFTRQITRIEERQHQHDTTISEHARAIATLEATRALTAELDAVKSRVKTMEDDALLEKGKRKAWGIVIAVGGGIAGALFKTALSLVPKLF